MLARTKKVNLSENLKYRFLYLNDLSSVNILINLLESEDNLSSLYPKYSSKGQLKKYIKRQMRGRLGNDLAAKNLTDLIHSDVNRYELLMYLEGYRTGFHSRKQANKLEELILNDLDISDLYKSQLLEKFIEENKIIQEYKKGLLAFVRKEVVTEDFLKRIISNYSRKIIRPKVYSLNKHLDVQIMVEYDDKNDLSFTPESKPFSRRELSHIYRKINTRLYKLGIDIYVDAFWIGLLEKVKKRYR